MLNCSEIIKAESLFQLDDHINTNPSCQYMEMGKSLQGHSPLLHATYCFVDYSSLIIDLYLIMIF
jgi:hypothetical protein